MRHIHFKTKVTGKPDEVFMQFDEQLFRFLKPPAFLAEIIRYDGTFEGAQVEIRFKFPLPQTMKVRIEHYSSDTRSFTDRGQILPFGITWWEHHHRVLIHKQNEQVCFIEDDIHFDAPGFRSWLLWAAFYLSFWLRKPAYRSYFKRRRKSTNGNQKI